MTSSVALVRDPNAPLETERPELGTALIPKERYTSRVFAEREWHSLWRRVWHLAGPACDLADPGDYFTFEFGTESVLVVRQQNGEVAAHYNVCSHRGNRLVPPGRGNARRFSCSFHGWCYGTDGALIEALDAHTFPQGVPPGELGLPPVRCEQWAGFVWVNFSVESEPLADFLGPVAAEIEFYRFEEWVIDYDVTIEIDCNWKTCVDAFNESYHVTATHPQALPVADDLNCPIDFYGRHTRLIFRQGIATPRHAEHGSVTQEVRPQGPGRGPSRRGETTRCRRLGVQRRSDDRQLHLHALPERHRQHPLALHLGVPAPSPPGRSQQDVLRFLVSRAAAEGGRAPAGAPRLATFRRRAGQ
jgi:phenylpropionate dioxygenase-like ring-hydroxylating dioxygenase large terminal subunit